MLCYKVVQGFIRKTLNEKQTEQNKKHSLAGALLRTLSSKVAGGRRNAKSLMRVMLMTSRMVQLSQTPKTFTR